MLPKDELQTCWHSPGFYEVFAHPETAAEIVQQSTEGALKVNGTPAKAEIVHIYDFGTQVRIVTR